MKNDPRQLELFSDGARAVAGAQRPKPAPLSEEHLQAKLAGARQRLREIVILGMMPWLPEETRKELAKIEGYARGQVRVDYRVLERFRAECSTGRMLSCRAAQRRVSVRWTRTR